MFRAPARVIFGHCLKSGQKDSLNLRFKNPRMLYFMIDSILFTSRSQYMVDFDAYDALAHLLRRCR